MTWSTVVLMLVSIGLSTTSQILLKLGMSSPRMAVALAGGDIRLAVMTIITSGGVIAGLGLFGLSAAVWLLVLSRVNVSQAYPCVALGFVATVVAGHFLFREPVALTQVAGLALIVAGVSLVAIGPR